MRTTSIFVSLVLAIVIVGGLAKPVHSYTEDESNTMDIYARSKDAIVSILAMRSDGTVQGAGAFFSKDGLIVTAYHVIQNAKFITIHLSNGLVYEAIVERTYPNHDLAVIKVNAKRSFPYLSMRQSDEVLIGQKILVIGYPLLERQLSVGHISQIDKNRAMFITDAAINPGNSGGPVLDSDGEIIGVADELYNPAGIRANAGINGVCNVDDIIDAYPQDNFDLLP